MIHGALFHLVSNPDLKQDLLLCPGTIRPGFWHSAHLEHFVENCWKRIDVGSCEYWRPPRWWYIAALQWQYRDHLVVLLNYLSGDTLQSWRYRHHDRGQGQHQPCHCLAFKRWWCHLKHMNYNAKAVQYASKHLRPTLCSDYGNRVCSEHKQYENEFPCSCNTG